MPPSKTPDPSCIHTRAWNENVHPRTAPKDALRAQNPPQDPEVIQKEKVDREVKKAAKQKVLEETWAREESATQFVEEYRACKKTKALNEDMAMPHQRLKGQCLSLLMRIIILYCTQLVKNYLKNQQMAMPPTAVVRYHAAPLIQVSKPPQTILLILLQSLLQSRVQNRRTMFRSRQVATSQRLKQPRKLPSQLQLALLPSSLQRKKVSSSTLKRRH